MRRVFAITRDPGKLLTRRYLFFFECNDLKKENLNRGGTDNE
jgi:hypothetical protein